MHFTIKCAAEQEDFDLDEDSLLSDLQDLLFTRFAISPAKQKLLLKGKAIPKDDAATLKSSGITPNSRLFLLGAKDIDVQRMTDHTAFLQHKASVIAARKPVKVTSTAKASSTRFHFINPFAAGPTTPHYEQRKAFLHRLSTDPAVLHIMAAKDRDWIVLELGELHPHTQPTLLGLNTNNNAGTTNTTLKIELRILTDDLEGVRSYNGVRRVLLHELSHIRHPNHELPFKELDSQVSFSIKPIFALTDRSVQLAKELAAFYSDPARKGNRLGGDLFDEYDPTESQEVGSKMLASGKCHVDASDVAMPSGGERLGGNGLSSDANLSPREMLARAAEKRKSKP